MIALSFFFPLRSPYASENVAALQKQQNKKLSALLSNLVLTLSNCPQYINCSQTTVSRLVTRAIPSCFKQVQLTSSTTSLHWKRVHQCVKWRNKCQSSQFKPCCQIETPPPELLNSLLQVVLGTSRAYTQRTAAVKGHMQIRTFPAAFRLNKSRFCWWEETERSSTSSSALSAFHLKDVLKKTVERINGSSKKSLHLKPTPLQWCRDKIATLWAWLGALVTGRSLQHGNIHNHKWASLPTASDHSISTRFVKTDNNVPWQHNQSHIIASLSYLKFQ